MTLSWDDPPARVAQSRTEIPFLHQGNDYRPIARIDQGRLSQFAQNLSKAAAPTEVQPVEQQPTYEVVWEPIPNSSQSFALSTRAHHTLYHGCRGPGKTACQLMRFRSRVGIGYGSYWRGVIFDREFKNLSDLVAQALRFFPLFEDGAEWKKSQSEYKWVWPTGEELLFRHVKHPEDYDSFHGHEYPFIGWNELTKQPTSFLYDKFMSVNRSSFVPEKHTPKTRLASGGFRYETPDGRPLPPIPLEVFSTTNPNGPGHNWVKKRFIDVARNGEVVKKSVTFHDPLKKEDVTVVRKQVAIFGSFYENPYLDPVYRAGLIEACANDPNLHAAWIEGRWDVNAGGAIDDLWRSDVHIVDRFKIPPQWKIDRTFDWGSTHPFSVIWWAEANGEEVELPNGRTWCPQRGSLIAFEEYYGSLSIGSNAGLKMSATDIAKNILLQEKILFESGWIKRKVQAGPADNQIRNVTESDVDTIEVKMAREGVRWTESDKSPGSRIIGLQLFRDRLQHSLLQRGPGVYFMRNCEACIELLPTLPRDPDKPDDVDTDSEDHIWDAVRYRILKGNNRYATKIKTHWPI
jgi:hypothetical protein